MGQLDQLMRVMEDRKTPRKRSAGYARVDIDSLDDLKAGECRRDGQDRSA